MFGWSLQSYGAMPFAVIAINERAASTTTPAMALRLGKFFGNGPDFWLNLQREYDLRTLEPQMAEELAAIETVAA